VKYTEKPDTPEEVVLAHYGVKGMRWGERHAKPTSGQIRDARIRQAARFRSVQNAEDNLNLTSSSAPKAKQMAAVKKYQKAAFDFDTNEDRVTASRLTRGEKAVQIILGGPIALVTIPVSSAITKATAKDVDKKRKAGPDAIK
jgi:hypothetical protein